jgi:hypothetical protein
VFGEARHYDLAISTEVAEHISAEFADRLVDLIATLADNVVFTAATPGQGGGTQPHVYWIDKFAFRGFAFDDRLSAKWSSEWERAGIAACYFRNIMVFRKQAALA